MAKLDENGIFNTSSLQDVPEGYELVTVGDFSDGDANADGNIVLKFRRLKKKQEYAYIQYVDSEGGYVVGYGVAKLNEYGYFNTSSLQMYRLVMYWIQLEISIRTQTDLTSF